MSHFRFDLYDHFLHSCLPTFSPTTQGPLRLQSVTPTSPISDMIFQSGRSLMNTISLEHTIFSSFRVLKKEPQLTGMVRKFPRYKSWAPQLRSRFKDDNQKNIYISHYIKSTLQFQKLYISKNCHWKYAANKSSMVLKIIARFRFFFLRHCFIGT